VIDEFPENFRQPGSDPCKLGVFRIKLKDGTKCHVALPRRTSPLVLDEMRRQVLQMELDGVAEKCPGNPQSIYAVVMVRHPTKPGLRFCLDARPLNENTLLMPYQVPEIQESLDELAGYKYYCSFDLTAYFTQFELAEECKDMTAFLVPGDKDHAPQIWRFRRMIFGLVNGSFFAQKQLQEALATWPGCRGIKNFIDDCCIVVACEGIAIRSFHRHKSRLTWNESIYYHRAAALLLWQCIRPQAVPASPRADHRANRSRTPALAQTVALQK
jgi:hypothetical protein